MPTTRRPELVGDTGGGTIATNAEPGEPNTAGIRTFRVRRPEMDVSESDAAPAAVGGSTGADLVESLVVHRHRVAHRGDLAPCVRSPDATREGFEEEVVSQRSTTRLAVERFESRATVVAAAEAISLARINCARCTRPLR